MGEGLKIALGLGGIMGGIMFCGIGMGFATLNQSWKGWAVCMLLGVGCFGASIYASAYA